MALIRLFSLLCAALLCSACAEQTISTDKKIIGPTADFLIDDVAQFKARIDTGAARTSINAQNIQVMGASDDGMRQDVGKTVTFTLVNGKGESWPVQSVIKDVVKIKNSQGVERRYVVPMRIGWGSINKTIDVNIRDRGAMKYKLLIGRDWLANEVVVDVEHGQ